MEEVANDHQERTNLRGGILAVFNASEAYDFYLRQKEIGINFINIVSFHGAKFPCTVGMVIDQESNGIGLILQLEDIPQDEHIYFIYGLQKDFLSPSTTPLVELCMSGAFSLSNPFDPALVNEANQRALQHRNGITAKYPVLYKKQGDKLIKIGPIRFQFEVLHTDERIDSVLFNRIVELAGSNAMCEIFNSGLKSFHALPNTMRRAGGDIDSTKYKSYSEFQNLLTGHVDAALRQFVGLWRNDFTYENAVRIVRALSLSAEVGKLSFSAIRWPQILSITQLSAEEQTRQFEIEVIRLATESQD